MATKLSLLSISLGFLLLFHGCLARQQGQQQQQFQQGQCQFRSLSAREPTGRVQAEAGETEFFDQYDQQFQCAGVFVSRHNIQPRGLLLPSYTNSPLLAYVEQGRGYWGITLPGCPETFQSSQQSQQEYGGGRREGRGQDKHQKIRHFQQGDILAIPAGAAHWTYNDGENDLVLVVLHDTSNSANQLDQNSRRFFIAGNPQQDQQQQQKGRRYTREGQQQQQQQQQQQSGNVLSGFDAQILAEAFGVDQETARRLQGENDQRGHIVRVERDLQVIRPPMTREDQEREERQRGGGNGLEETVCTMSLRENIDNPSRADIFNPQAGRFTTVNSFNLPVLRFLQLSAERGVLRRNALMAPHWSLNSHSIIYATRGDARIQIVDNRGQAVFDEQLREGQLVVAPQNFAVVKQAGERGFEWVAFRTNDNAMINTLSGRTSAFRALPVDVIANAYQISREEARTLKFNREETFLFSPSSRSARRGGSISAAVGLVEELLLH